jgi:hypothetical protein
VNCELALEFAKDKVWEESLRVLEDQVYLLGKQHHRLYRLLGKVDVVVTDSPLLLALVYGMHWGDEYAALALALFRRHRNLTFVVQREKEYNPAGRLQSEQKARGLDGQVLDLLEANSIGYERVPGRRGTEQYVADVVERELGKVPFSVAPAR